MQKQKYPRSSGVLLSVPMLNGPFGIGVLGREAMAFVDFLSDSGFHAWQILPVEHTGICFSPYKCLSAFAGEPMLIDPRELLESGLITPDELDERADGLSEHCIDYERVREQQLKLLRTAFGRLNGARPHAGFRPFWLDNYALYMAIKQNFDDSPWYLWPDAALRGFDAAAVREARERFSEDIEFYKFVQWLFHKQWRKLLKYASARKISIIGDMPIYVSEDSADVWSRRELFDADENGNFPAVGGVPPDYFTPDGQRWGNPVYNWTLMAKDGYEWWIHRMKEALARYDIVRIDHFRGFESYWRIPSGDETARGGKWAKGPGMAIFKAMEQALGKLPVIAEDLGIIDEKVENLLQKTGYRGMRVLQFGFLGDSGHLPHSFTSTVVAYSGTHDNTTLLAWMYGLLQEDREKALFYLGFDGDWTAGGPNCPINTAWIRMLFMSGASAVIIPVQDLLGYGADTRTNIPGTADGNWRFRVTDGALREIDSGFYAALNKACGRDNAL